jgi:hypothetical protein
MQGQAVSAERVAPWQGRTHNSKEWVLSRTSESKVEGMGEARWAQEACGETIKSCRAPGLTPIIPAAWEAEIRRIQVQGQPR